MKKVTDQEILTKVYVNRKEVEQLLQMPREPVAKLFSQIQKKEQEALGDFYVWGQKVRLKTVLESQGISQKEMEKIVLQRGQQEPEKRAPCTTRRLKKNPRLENITNQKKSKGEKTHNDLLQIE